MMVLLGPLKAHFVAWLHWYVIGATVHLSFNLMVNILIAVVSFHLLKSPIMRLKERFSYAQCAGRVASPERTCSSNALKALT